MRLLMVGFSRLDAMQRHVNWAVESGLEVTVADLRRYEGVKLPSSVRRVALLPARPHGVGRSGINRRKSARATRIGALRLRSITNDFQPQVIHSYSLSFYTDMCLEAGLRPLVVSVWASLNKLMETGLTITERLQLRRVKRGADTLLVENPNLLNALASFPIEPLKVECFPIGVDGTVFHPDHQEKAAAWRFALNIPADAIVLLSPRGWNSIYGQQHIMQAFADAHHRLEKPLVLVLIGLERMKRPDRLAQEVHDLGISLGVGHAIRWIPQVPFEDMPGVYSLADIVVNYPRSDAFPSTLLEAAACARPVITSNLSAYRNTFIERFCRLVEPENPVALAEALIDLVASDPAMRAARAEQARQAVLAEYEESIQKERLLAVYHRVAFENMRRLRVPIRHGYR